MGVVPACTGLLGGALVCCPLGCWGARLRPRATLRGCWKKISPGFKKKKKDKKGFCLLFLRQNIFPAAWQGGGGACP